MTNDTTIPILLARIADAQLGLPAEAVREIVRAVAITPVPSAPAIVEGVVNLRGRVVPVVDIRLRLGLPPAELTPAQYLVMLETGDRIIAIRVDDVSEVLDIPDAALERPSSVSPILARLSGVASLDSGAAVIYDVGAFLTQAEDDALQDAIAGLS